MKTFIVGRKKVRVHIQEEGDRLFLTFGYNSDLLAEVKMMQGRKWHPATKQWSVDNTLRNQFQIAYLSGENPYAPWDAPLIPYPGSPLGNKPYLHQQEMICHGLTRHYCIWAAEMGCIAGDMKVRVRNGRGDLSKLTLQEFYNRWSAGYRDWTILSQGTEVFENKVEDVIYSGNKELLRLFLKSNKTLNCTPDHRIMLTNGEYVACDMLRIGDSVMTIRGPDMVSGLMHIGRAEVFDVSVTGPNHNFYANDVCVHNCGKSLAAIEVMALSGHDDWWWVAPKAALESVKLECIKWNSKVRPKFLTYEGLVKEIKNWPKGKMPPHGVLFDESSRVRNATSQRSQAAFYLAENIHKLHGQDGYVILMSGSPAPKNPTDWWFQCEIAQPGYLKEGDIYKFTERLAFTQKQQNLVTGGTYIQKKGWKCDESLCDKCGLPEEHDNHKQDIVSQLTASNATMEVHDFVKSKNEVSYLYKRMEGLVLVKTKKECIDLPDKVYRTIKCKVTRDVMNAAKLIKANAKSAAVALVHLRELSDGFQYKEVEDGVEKCPMCRGYAKIDNPDNNVGGTITCPGCYQGYVKRMVRTAVEVPCPKDDALVELLEDLDDAGRVVIYAGFTASVDKIIKMVSKQEWEWIRVDQGAWRTSVPNLNGPGNMISYFQETNRYQKRCAFVAHPKSAGMGLTLTASDTIIYYSNDFDAESRIQSEDRIHRVGMKSSATIIDLVHLPTDQLVLDNLQKKRDLQSMTLGELDVALAE